MACAGMNICIACARKTLTFAPELRIISTILRSRPRQSPLVEHWAYLTVPEDRLETNLPQREGKHLKLVMNSL